MNNHVEIEMTWQWHDWVHMAFLLRLLISLQLQCMRIDFGHGFAISIPIYISWQIDSVIIGLAACTSHLLVPPEF